MPAGAEFVVDDALPAVPLDAPVDAPPVVVLADPSAGLAAGPFLLPASPSTPGCELCGDIFEGSVFCVVVSAAKAAPARDSAATEAAICKDFICVSHCRYKHLRGSASGSFGSNLRPHHHPCGCVRLHTSIGAALPPAPPPPSALRQRRERSEGERSGQAQRAHMKGWPQRVSFIATSSKP